MVQELKSYKNFFLERYKKLGGHIEPISLPVCLRINTLRASPKVLTPRLNSLGIVLEKIPFTKQGYCVKKTEFSLGAITEFLLGYYYLQEAAAQLPVEILDPKPGELVLDCCAAPGGKTTQLAQAMKNQGVIVAYELKKHRMVSLFTNLERMGATNAVVFQGDVENASTLGLEFDKILLDAPCAGNYATDPGWFEKRTFEGVKASARIQQRLLRIASGLLKQGGTLIYSTCSLEPEENELNMEWAVKELPLELEPVKLKTGDPGLTNVFGRKLSPEIAFCRRFWPHKTKTQGFFIARLRKC
jgi:NOL1/NOP2/sun family putative RNA methylase